MARGETKKRLRPSPCFHRTSVRFHFGRQRRAKAVNGGVQVAGLWWEEGESVRTKIRRKKQTHSNAAQLRINTGDGDEDAVSTACHPRH